ncbi:MAG: S-layer homology domain-containing protein, partial [Bacillota bacterium]
LTNKDEDGNTVEGTWGFVLDGGGYGDESGHAHDATYSSMLDLHFTPDDTETYAEIESSVIVHIEAKEVKIVAKDVFVGLGDEEPTTYEYTVDGFVTLSNGTVEGFSTNPVFVCEEHMEAYGNYAIYPEVHGTASANYSLKHTNGYLHVAELFTVTFDTAGGSAITAQSVYNGDVAKAVEDPTRSGYIFTGWTLDGEAFDFTEKITGDSTLVATWEVDPDASAGTGTDTDTGAGTGTTGTGTNTGATGGSTSAAGSGSDTTTKPSTDGTGDETTTEPGTGTGTPTLSEPTTTPVLPPSTTVEPTDTVTTTDPETGNKTDTTVYEGGTEVTQTTTPSGEVTGEVSGVTGNTTLVIPVDTTPTLGQVVVVTYPDGTTAILPNGVPDGDGFRVTIDSNVTYEIVDNTKYFIDVLPGSWYEEAVIFVTSRELFVGMTPEIFAPDKNMTRAMFWQVLYNYIGTLPTDSTGEFWYSDAQAWAKEIGISDGFNPDRDITRQEAVTILHRMVGTPLVSGDVSAGFADYSDISEWADDGMNWAIYTELLVGSNGNLKPTTNITRAEVAMLLMKFLSM